MNRFASLCISVVLLCSPLAGDPAAFELPPNTTLYENIKELYLKSFKTQSSLKADVCHLVLAEQQKMNQVSLIFDLFSRGERQETTTPIQLILPLISIDNINLFCGNKSKPKHTVLSQVARTTTLMGHAYFARLLAQPTDDLKTLTNRQDIIYALLDDQALYMQLRTALQEIAATESHLLALWQSPEQAGKNVKDSGFYYQLEYLQKWNPSAHRLVESINNNPHALGLKAHSAKLAAALCFISVIGQTWTWWSEKTRNKDGLLENTFLWPPNPTIAGTFNFWKHAYNLFFPFFAIPATIWLGLEAYPKDAKETEEAFTNSGNRLLHINKLFDALTIITQSIKTHPTLVKNLTQVHHLINVMEAETIPYKLQRLKDLLKVPECTKKNNYPSGTLLVAYKLLDEIKDNFVCIMQALGEIDAYISAATLFSEHAHRKNRYSFVAFCKTDKPYLKLNQFFNPYLPTKNPVLNDLELGTPGRARNLILSGPNAGGKSTYLKGALLTVLMAQVFGIAPAQAIKMTPFSYLDIYKDIVDDAANQKSLFKAEVGRVKTLINQARSLGKDQFSLIITDEMFSGTNPLDATDLNRAVAEEVATIENSMWMISTHFYDVTKVEQDTNGIFKNSQVVVARNEYGDFSHYTFKIKDGTTQDSTALDILKMENIDPQIIIRAEELKKNRNHKSSWGG